MKIIYKLVLAFLIILCVIVGTYREKISSNVSEQVQIEYLEEAVTFEKAVNVSDIAIVGKFIETIEYDYYVEHKFEVVECLYGNTDDPDIFLYMNKGTGYIPEINYEYELSRYNYREGEQYILIMEKLQSILYDHDRYMLCADTFINENTKEYTLYSKPIEIDDGVSIKDYILSLRSERNASGPSETNPDETVYENSIDEMIQKSEYIGNVEIIGIYREGKVHNGNTYFCKVHSLIMGDSIQTYDDGTILMVLLKGTVEVGKNYIIGFSPVDENSLVYIQSTKSSVYNENEESVIDYILTSS